MGIGRTLLRFLIKTLLFPVSLILLLIKGVLCLAIKLIELPVGLLLWLVVFIVVVSIFKHEWKELGIGAVTLAIIGGILFIAEGLIFMIDELREKIQAI